MIGTLILPDALLAQIESQARVAFPRECCGLIEGVEQDGVLRATALYPTRNLSIDADRFEIDPADHFAAQRAARSNGHAIIGCYHSHPNGVARPSVEDRADALEDGFVWLVCGVSEKQAATGAFVFEKGDFQPLTLRTTPAP